MAGHGPQGSLGQQVVEFIGDSCHDCVMALGSLLDWLTDSIRGIGKSPLVNVEGLGSKLNPMNWARQMAPSPSVPGPEPKLGRSAHLAMEMPVIQKPVIERPAIEPLKQSMSKYQGDFDQIKGLLGGNIGLDLNFGETIKGLVPNCAHFGTSMRALTPA